MRKVLLIPVLLIATFAFAHHGPKSVTIDAAAKKQAPVVFSHEKHATTLVPKCETCHHTNKGLTAEKGFADVKKCSTCHLDPKAGVPGMREMSMQKNPFHALCVDCHKEQKKGPTTCTACHQKKK